jgi:hypothetical protein
MTVPRLIILGRAKAVGPQTPERGLGVGCRLPLILAFSLGEKERVLCRRVTRKPLSPIPLQVFLPSGERVSLSPREGRGEGEGRMAGQEITRPANDP